MDLFVCWESCFWSQGMDMAALKRWRGTESRWRLDGSMCKFTYFIWPAFGEMRGSRFSYRLGARDIVKLFSHRWHSKLLWNQERLWRRIYLTVQIVHCKCLKDLDILKSDNLGTFRTCKKAIPCYTLYLHPLTYRTCACSCAIGSRTGSMKPPENLCPWANWSRDLSPNFFRFPCGNVRAVSKETCSCTPG